MSYGSGYKRPRPDDFALDFPVGPGQYGPPGNFGPPSGPGMEPVLPPVGLGLGVGPDGSFPLVKLRGLPFSCDEQEIKMFLEVDTVDVVLVKREGRLSGEAFVLLPGIMQVEFALGKHKAYLGKRYVEVQLAYKEDYYRAVAAVVAETAATGGGPSTAPPSRRQFEPWERFPMDGPPYRPAPGMAMNGAGPLSMPRGPGPIREAAPRDMPPHAARAMPQRRPQERYNRPPPMDMPPQRMQGPPPAGDATGILKLRGLPFSASREDIAMWFNESGALFQPIDADCVHLVLAYDGRPTGSAFVEFLSPADAHNAMVRDKAMMGSRYVELFHSSREEVSHATG